jgi:cobalt-zinc-cadmium efflux system membrane fusion protein
MQLFKYRYIVFFALPAILFFAIGCKNKNELSTTKDEETSANSTNENTVFLTQAQFKNAPIETESITDRQISNVVKLNGKIDVPPQNYVSISIPLGGYLKSTHLLPGMKVAKGQNIATIENTLFIQLQQDYLSAQSKLHFLELDYNRQEKLNQAQASSDKVTQQAQTDMNNQRIIVNALAQQLHLININPATLTAENIQRSVS